MRQHLIAAVLFSALSCAFSQDANRETSYIKPGDNIVFENVPPIPTSVAEASARYGDSRSAQFLSWSPGKREMLITTRFADANEIHLVRNPGGEREQLTFFPDPVREAIFDPTRDDSLVFVKDIGGGEWYQFYRFDIASGEITLLTDGKSRNTSLLFEHHGSRLAYTSTRRNNQDTDLYLMDIHQPKTDHMLAQLKGGGWAPTDFSRDGTRLLLLEELSINQSNLYLVDVATGEKKQITPEQQAVQQVFYGNAVFSRDGKGIYLTTDRDSDFQRLAYFDLATMTPRYLTTGIPWDVEHFDLSEDGKTIAFSTNENGLSKLYLLDTASNKIRPCLTCLQA